jgi:DnaD/phage-associated family protein
MYLISIIHIIHIIHKCIVLSNHLKYTVSFGFYVCYNRVIENKTGEKMGKIILSSTSTSNVTIISNIFIDSYMPTANGDYVKVYLYLLRYSEGDSLEFSISFLADRLEHTEKDVLRALNYWDKTKLIELSKDSNNEIIGINLNDPKLISASLMEVQQTMAVTKVPLPLEESSATVTDSTPSKPVYSRSEIKELTNDDEIKWIMNIIEIYLERLLKPNDIQLILYLYDTIGFSAELIMYLYEYCVSKNKKNNSYIEAVALSWAKDGIDTVEKAESTTTLYNNNYNSINKAFGLNRTPGSIEKQYMDKWINKFHFSIEIIVEACNRTLLHTGKPDFKYADKILDNWKVKDVKNPADIANLDTEYNNKSRPTKSKPNINSTKNSNNQFNAFPQRTYTSNDYSSMEKRLLNKQ